MNDKIKDAIAIFMLQLVISLPFYTLDAFALKISNVKATKVDTNYATIEWQTDAAADGKVDYGKTTSLGSSKKQSELATSHAVNLTSGITPDTTYFFSVESKDSSGNTALDNNSDSFYTFKTPNAQSAANTSENKSSTAKDTTPPEIKVAIPRYVNRRVISISGTTEPFSAVSLFVNNMNSPVRTISSNEVGSSGKFAFSQIQLAQNNVVRILAVDKSGNKNEKSFDVGIDTDLPIVKLANITKLTSKPNITISGTVNEPVTVKVFADVNANASSAPAKITGLNATKIDKNSIELKWDESKDKDFSHYIVYREDSGPIAVTNPSNFNLFIDALVDSGKQYTYRVSVMNIFGIEGPKSDPLTVKTLESGQTLNLKYNTVDVLEEFRKPIFEANASNNFEFGIRLNNDGVYNIKLIFEDKAGNKVTLERTLTLDTKKPFVKIISPPAGAFIFENVANQVDVIGKTKPNSRVHLYVDRTPFSAFDTSIVVSGVPSEAQNLPKSIFDFDINRIENISDEELDAKCRLNKVTRAACSSAADRTVTADKDGNFEFEKVDLSSAFGIATRLREVPVTEFRDTILNQETRESRRTTLVVIATDQTGQRGLTTQAISIGNCWSGNQSWDIIPLTQYQSPTLLSTERLAEGTEALYFFFNYSYIGRGTNAKIKSISLSRACGTGDIIDSRFNISCKVMPQGDTPTKLNKPDNTVSYSAIPLTRYPGMETFLEKDWKSFLNALRNEMTFPFRVRITYQHDILDENGAIKTATETQTTCQQVSYVVDSTIIDPRKFLPGWLTHQFVDFLQGAIKTLTEIQEKIDKVINYVAPACLWTFFAHTAYKIYRTWIDLSNEKLFKFMNFDPECQQLAKAIERAHGSMQLKYFSDPDLKKCFPSSYAAWKNEAKFYEWQRWSCDRIFGHTTPSRWTETVSDDDLNRQISTPTTCKGDGDERGQPIIAVDCASIEGKYEKFGIHNFNRQPVGKKCFEIKSSPSDQKASFVWTLADDQDSTLTVNGLYKLVKYEDRPREDFIYAIKRTETLYLTYQPQTCDQLCGTYNTPTTKRKITTSKGETIEYNVKEGRYIAPGEEKPKNPEDQVTRAAGCVPVNECREWYTRAVDIDPRKRAIQFGNTIIQAYNVENKGYTYRCFYEGQGDNPDVVSPTNPNTREICCCVNGKAQLTAEYYYQPEDKDEKLEGALATGQFQATHDPFVHESKTGIGAPKASASDATKFSDMKWSYRYQRIGYLNKKYNPLRYIEGRDLPACFGQDNQFYKIFGDEKKIVTLNPFKQDTTALQCAYLTGINQRLQLYKNIMTAMSNCLIEIRESGRADAGVCKELFTQHVCGLIWQAVRFFVEGCTPEDISLDAEDKENAVIDKLRLGFTGIARGITESQQEMAEEYQNVKLNNFLGIGEGGVARKICLGAFGYDWNLNARNLIDAAYSAPFATLVQPVTKSREFLNVDPITLRPRYEYRASWIVNPGCDLENYRVELACVTRKELDQYPNSINCGRIGTSTGISGTSTGYNQCDCLELDREQGPTYPVFIANSLKQNILSEQDFHKVPDTDYRYDHLKFTLRTDRRIPLGMQQNCLPTGYEKGVFYFPLHDKTAKDIADCTVDPLSGVFRCSGGVDFFSRKGIVQLIEVRVNDENAENFKDKMELNIGDQLRVTVKVTKTGTDKCLRVRLTPDIIGPAYAGIELDGTSEIGPLLVTDQIRVAGRVGNIIAPNIAYNPIAQSNEQPVTINTLFIDTQTGKPNDRKQGIFSPDDTIVIDGYDVKLESSSVNPTANAYPATTVSVEGNKIKIEKQGAALEITGVTYPPQSAPGAQIQLQQVITVNPPQESTLAQQQKTLIVEIFHLREDRESYDENPDNCNFNDKILEKQYKLTVTEKGDDVSRVGPVIATPRVNPRTQDIGKPIEISARITHKSGVEKAEVTVTGPDGAQILRPADESQAADALMQKIDDVIGYTYTIDTSDPRFSKPGKYAGNIKATSTTGTVSNKAFDFTLREQRTTP